MFQRTRAALATYDAHAATLDSLDSDKQIEAWSKEEERLGRLVSEAFADDTAGVNSRETVLSCIRPCYWTQDDFLHRITKETP